MHKTFDGKLVVYAINIIGHTIYMISISEDITNVFYLYTIDISSNYISCRRSHKPLHVFVMKNDFTKAEKHDRHYNHKMSLRPKTNNHYYHYIYIITKNPT